MSTLTDLQSLFDREIILNGNLISFSKESSSNHVNQKQTAEIFSDKWTSLNSKENTKKLLEFNQTWFPKLYGFKDETDLAEYLSSKKIIADAGCGLGYKAEWLAKLSPNSLVLGIDISDAVNHASQSYKDVPNLFFLKADIADTGMKNDSVDFMICDQVIMHTESPENTFKHLSSITKLNHEFACYVYSKKALPRELLDDYFRKQTHHISNDEMWAFSQQLTELGKTLSELNVKFTSPEIPLLGIKGGEYDLQRFLYWNFLKCFWKEDWGQELSRATNYDWYAPSNATRFSEAEFKLLISKNNLSISYFHSEEACYSGRFKKFRNQ